MEITQASFYLFIGLSCLIYWLIQPKFRWYVLLIDSVVFCAVNSHFSTYIFVLVNVSSVYAATMLFGVVENVKAKKAIVTVTLLLNVGILAYLKYLNLFIDSINYVSGRFGGSVLNRVSWYAPIGLSFYTLTLISYLLDTYWGVASVEKNPLKLLLYLLYFPLLVSGPILRERETKHRLFESVEFDHKRAVAAVRRIAWGLLKKMVVADRLALVVSFMFSNPDLYKGLWVLIAGFAFIIELYFDFSGCMDIIIGISACFGIELPENFKAPFLSKSMQEFWQRWHITLGLWLRDYIMNPILKSEPMRNLAGHCKKAFGKGGKKIPSYIAMFVLWTAMGLWHGNSWKYIVGEGWWFWLIIVLEQVLEPSMASFRKRHGLEGRKWYGFLRICRVLLLYNIGMLFFRAESLASSFEMVKNIFAPMALRSPAAALYDNLWDGFGGLYAVIVVLFVFVLQILCDIKTYKGNSMQETVSAFPTPIRWALYFILMLTIVVFGMFGKSAFIYFGF